jgi:hypothetical protein
MDTTEEPQYNSSPLFSTSDDSFENNSSLGREDIKALLTLKNVSPSKASTSKTPEHINHKEILTKMALVRAKIHKSNTHLQNMYNLPRELAWEPKPTLDRKLGLTAATLKADHAKWLKQHIDTTVQRVLADLEAKESAYIQTHHMSTQDVKEALQPVRDFLSNTTHMNKTGDAHTQQQRPTPYSRNAPNKSHRPNRDNKKTF